jgi:hypothetical protein
MGIPRVQHSRAHQKALTTGPFGNTSEADAVSPEVEIGGCRTQVSTTKRNEKGIENNNTHQSSYSLYPLNLLCKLCLRSTTTMK